MIKINIEQDYLDLLYELLSEDDDFLSLGLKEKENLEVDDISKVVTILKDKESLYQNTIEEKKRQIEEILSNQNKNELF